MHGWFCFGKESDSSRRVILKIKLELNNLNSILSRSAVTLVFPRRRTTRMSQADVFCVTVSSEKEHSHNTVSGEDCRDLRTKKLSEKT